MVVAAGETVTDDPVTVPIGAIESAGAGLPVTDHDRVADCPAIMDDGDAVKDVIAGALRAAVGFSAATMWLDAAPLEANVQDRDAVPGEASSPPLEPPPKPAA